MTNAKTVKLSANENCYGCSPAALEAIQNKIRDVYMYPEVTPVALKERLAIKYGVKVKNIILGAGSVGIINNLIQTFVAQDEEVLTFENSFIAYRQLCGFHNRKCLMAPLDDLRCNPENLIPLINEKTRLIFISNPNNPTGTIISHLELERFLEKIASKIIVVIDEAYAEYVTAQFFPNSIELQKKFPNLVILHSFSKIYGLAGLRIGYAIMNEEYARKVSSGKIPFSLNYLSSVSAIASLDDANFIKESCRKNAEQRDYLYYELKRLGYNTVQSHANFIYLWFEADEDKKRLYELLLQNGIMICDMKIFGQEKALRITIGNSEVNKRIVSLIINSRL